MPRLFLLSVVIALAPLIVIIVKFTAVGVLILAALGALLGIGVTVFAGLPRLVVHARPLGGALALGHPPASSGATGGTASPTYAIPSPHTRPRDTSAMRLEADLRERSADVAN